MGYYTNYKMIVLDENGRDTDSAENPVFEDKDLYGSEVSVQQIIEGDLDACKWYDHDKDMIEYSKRFPDFVFILDGEGEESGDIWRKFYKNGKSYEWKLEYALPDFDPNNLK